MHNENDVLDVLQEVYFGKTESIKAIEEQLDLFRKKYVGTNRKPKNDPDLYKLNRMIEEQFGFGRFGLMITLDPVPNAVTIPISYSFNTTMKKHNYSVDSTTYRFKKEYNYTCIITLTTGLIFNDYFTTEEVMACILYELGRNFYSCMSEDNALLSSVYTAVMIANTVSDTVSTFMKWHGDASKASGMVQNHIIQNLLKDPRLKKLYPDIDEKYGVDPEFTKMINDTLLRPDILKGVFDKVSIGIGGIAAAVTAFTSSPIYNKMVYGIVGKYKHHNPTRKVFYRFTDYLGMVASKTVMPAFDNIMSGKALFTHIGSTALQLILPYKDFISNVKNPLSWITMPVEYRVERAAENFPTMYGYGAEMSMYFHKLKANDNIKAVRDFVQRNPSVGIWFDVISTPSRVLNGVFDNTPNGISRVKDQMALLKYELKKEDLDPLMRQQIYHDLARLETALSKLIDTSQGEKDPNICKKLYNKALSDIVDGVGLKDAVFDDKKRFAKYDKNYERRK